jgi:hypothetical protein
MTTTPQLIHGSTIRTRNANLIGVGNTVLQPDVRIRVWDDYQRDTDGDAVRVADVRLTVDQAIDLANRILIAVQNAAANVRLAEAAVREARV